MVPIIASDNQKEFTPAPEGLHQAVCIDVVDNGLVETQWGKLHKITIVWEIEEIDSETKKPFQVRNRYTLSLNEKANLRKHLEAWRGRQFTKDQLKGFDVENLVGVNCQLQIIHNIRNDGKVFANVQAIVPLGKGMQTLRPSPDYVRAKDRKDQPKQQEEEEIPPSADDEDDGLPF